MQRHEHFGGTLRAADHDRTQRLVGRDLRDASVVLGAVEYAVCGQVLEHFGNVRVASDSDDQVAAVDDIAVGENNGPADDGAILYAGPDPFAARIVSDLH